MEKNQDITKLLLGCDIEKFKHLESKEVVSKRMTKKLGLDDDHPAKVRIGQIPYEKYIRIQMGSISENGGIDTDKAPMTATKIVVEGMIEPNLRSRDLQDYFGVASAEKLANLLFQGEITSLSDEIVAMSDNDEKVKN